MICKPSEHLFLPVLEVHELLLRCIHCDVFAYQDTVQQLARNRTLKAPENLRPTAPSSPGLADRIWLLVQRGWRRWRPWR